ncbi:MAG: rhodanese-like domain-containing protein [Anaeromicrobium sp.]|jgi:rhodanese-related sulfurtransferase|nr:rhodanese-like domain-containing protein [Anaeromicrobium sp.]MCT4593409.1 rhodanese-like domain-containing protein [Anaeromicrobium sp.]
MSISNDEIENVSVNQIKKAIKRGAILLDIRAKEDYNALHIENAINIP